jgi:hypothetical protein
MDAASILVLVLCVGGFALLVWFEMNSRANTAKKNQSLCTAQPDMGSVAKQATNTAESQASKKKAA